MARWRGRPRYESDNTTINTRDILVHDIFPKLRKIGIMCRANHLCCCSCASYDLAEKARSNKKIKGIVYWHKQTEEAIWWNGEVHIYYGGCEYLEKEENRPAYTSLEVGKLIQKELDNSRLNYDWDGSEHSSIRIILKDGIRPMTVQEAMENVVGL